MIGGSIPLTGVFAFAGIGINDGITDYVKIVNEAGGIAGRKVRYVAEDTGYKVDQSVAVFNKITGSNPVNFYYGDFDRLLEDHQSRAQPQEHDPDGRRVLRVRAERSEELSEPVHRRPGLFRDDRRAARLYRKDAARCAHRARQFRHRVRPRSDPDHREAGGEAKAQHRREDRDAADLGRRLDRSAEAASRQSRLHHLPRLCAGADARIHDAGQAARPQDQVHGHVLVDGQLALGEGRRCRRRLHGRDALSLLFRQDAPNAPMLAKIRQMRPEYQSTAYMQGFLTTMLFCESAKRTLGPARN